MCRIKVIDQEADYEYSNQANRLKSCIVPNLLKEEMLHHDMQVIQRGAERSIVPYTRAKHQYVLFTDMTSGSTAKSLNSAANNRRRDKVKTMTQ